MKLEGAGGHREGGTEHRPSPVPHSALCSPFLFFKLFDAFSLLNFFLTRTHTHTLSEVSRSFLRVRAKPQSYIRRLLARLCPRLAAEQRVEVAL